MTDLEVEYILSYVPMAKFKLDLNFDHIEKDILTMAKSVEGVRKSNVGGWQSDAFTMHKHYEPFNSIIENCINPAMQDYSKTMGLSGKVILNNYWINVNYRNNFNMMHTHPGAFLSGVFYIKCPENSGNIEFMNSEYDLIDAYAHANPSAHNWWKNDKNNFSFFFEKSHILEVESGVCYLFPAWKNHIVQPNNTDDPRISIAFNYNIDFGAKT